MKKIKWIMAGAALVLASTAVVGIRYRKNVNSKNQKTAEEATDKVSAEATQTERADEVFAEVIQTESPSQEPTETEYIEEPDKTSADVGETTNTQQSFYIAEISDEVFARMQGRSYKENCTVPRDELRYVHVLHRAFDGTTKEGELIVNVSIAQDILEIFEELYKSNYAIEKIRLVDEYNADDETSMSDNNSSAFNFRFISHTTTISKHGRGLAVDINPLYNPYIKTVNGSRVVEPANSVPYIDRDADFPHKITHDDLCYKLFTKHGFTWGGDWTHSKDYQHFEK